MVMTKNIHNFPPRLVRGALLLLILLAVVLMALWPRPSADRTIKLAAAKGGVIGTLSLTPSRHEQLMIALATRDPLVGDLLTSGRPLFLEAHPVGVSERLRYPGCESADCLHLSFYDFAEGGTIHAIFDPDKAAFVDGWRDPHARPHPTGTVVERVVRVAADDARVQAVLGSADGIRKAAIAMIPMSTWLADDDCRDDWCVDLTFHDPEGSGRIFHIVVNLHSERVARTFYTRGRPDRPAPELAWQETGRLFTDGCHEAAGWSVCWEMTPHDGVNFYNARYNGEAVFTTAKIGQVEAYYPSWPGGYRDEIGYAASVPPKYDTRLMALADGFEVRQLFTEPFDWPNCICCYRYEQVMQFFADGSFAASFISHGPGCDELSEYRPFWRINIAQPAGPPPAVAAWNGNAWEAVTTEQEWPLFGPLSVEGARLALIRGETGWLWKPTRTDPLQLDDGRLFAVLSEGDIPIPTGPANTFEPPRRYVDGESLVSADSDLVLWVVPALKTRRGDPWWCMPDPEPDFSPCDADLYVQRFTPPLYQPTAEEIAALNARPTPVLLPTPVADAATAPTRQPTPRPISGQSAEELVLNAGCGACHLIGQTGEAGKVGPDLSNIGNLAGQRVPGQSADTYLRNSILYPDLFIVPDCPNGPCLPGIMPETYFLTLDEAQLDTLVSHLMTLRTGEGAGTIGLARPTPTPPPLPGEAAGSQSAEFSPLWYLAGGLVLLAVAVVVVALAMRRR
jgi:hypothetical protein